MSKQLNKSLLLSIAAAGGVVLTALTAVFAGKKDEKLKASKAGKKERILNYIPTVVTTGATILLVATNYKYCQNQIQDLTALYSAAALKLQSLTGKKDPSFADIHPEKAHPKRDIVNDFDDTSFTDELSILFYDDMGGRYFESTISQVLSAEKEMNRMFSIGSIPSLNDFYGLIGLSPTEKGKEIGWSPCDGDYYWIDFYHYPVELEDGMVCWVIDAEQQPTEKFLDDCWW